MIAQDHKKNKIQIPSFMFLFLRSIYHLPLEEELLDRKDRKKVVSVFQLDTEITFCITDLHVNLEKLDILIF